MGPTFGGMLLSGRKAAGIAEDLLASAASASRAREREPAAV